MTELADFSELESSQIWNKIKSNTDSKAWAVFKLDDENKKLLRVVSSGRCALDRVHKHLKDDEISFGIFRVYAVEAGIKQPKFFFFKWAGPTAPLKRKVASNTVKTSVQAYFSPVHGQAEFDAHDQLTEEEIIKRLLASRGSHKPSRWEFGTGNSDEEEDEEREAREKAARDAEEARLKAIADAEEARLKAEAERLAEEARLKVIADAEEARLREIQEAEDARLKAIADAEEARLKEIEEARLAEEARIAAEEARLKAEEDARLAEEKRLLDEKERKLKMLPSFQQHKARQLAQNPDIQGYDFSSLTSEYLLECLVDVENPIAWVMCRVTEEEPKKIQLVGKGGGGVDEFIGLLADDDIMYGAFRVTAVDRKGTRVSLRARIVYFIWNGAIVNSKVRFRNTAVIRAMSAYFTGTSLELKLNADKSDLNPDNIKAALSKATGPASDFKFGTYDKEAQVDEYLAQVDTAKKELTVNAHKDAALDKEFAAKQAAKMAMDRAEAEKRSAEELHKAAKLHEEDRKERELKAAQQNVSTARAAADIISASRGAGAGAGATPAKKVESSQKSWIPKVDLGTNSGKAPAAVTAKAAAANAASAAAAAAAESAPAPAPAAVEEEAAPAPAPAPAAVEEEAAPAPAPAEAVVEEAAPAPAPAAAEEAAPAPAPAAAEEAAPAPAAAEEAAPAPAPAAEEAAPAPAPAAAAKKADSDSGSDSDSDDEKTKKAAPAPAPAAAAKKADSDSDSDSDDEKTKKSAPAPAPAAAAKKADSDSDSDSDSDDEKTKKAAPAPAPAPAPAAAAKKAASDSDSDSSSDSDSDDDKKKKAPAPAAAKPAAKKAASDSDSDTSSSEDEKPVAKKAPAKKVESDSSSSESESD